MKNLQPFLSKLRRADEDFGLITAGDKIAVGLSGGKDSLLLLSLLANYKIFAPRPFELCAITVDAGSGADFSLMNSHCESLGVPYHLIKTDIYDVVFNVRKESNPCSLCAKMRRGALASKMNELGYNVLALGHHGDDFVETFLLSLVFEGRLSTLQVKSYLDQTKVTVIRPMIYIREQDIRARERDLPVVFNPCPANHETNREYMKKLIASVKKDFPFAFDNMLNALTNPDRNNLLKKPKKS